jgi:hypothetical protein
MGLTISTTNKCSTTCFVVKLERILNSAKKKEITAGKPEYAAQDYIAAFACAKDR